MPNVLRSVTHTYRLVIIPARNLPLRGDVRSCGDYHVNGAGRPLPSPVLMLLASVQLPSPVRADVMASVQLSSPVLML